MSEEGIPPRARHRALATCALLACLWGSAESTPAQDASAAADGAGASSTGEPAASGDELLRLQDRLRRRTESALAERKQQQERLDELDAEARAARRKNDAIARQIEEQQGRLATIRGEAEAAETRSRELEEREARLEERIRTFLTALDERIAAGIPWKIADRRQAVSDSLQVLDDPRTAAAAALATLARLQKEQEAVGRLVESGTIEVETAAGPVAVPGFHLGLLGVVFASDDGQVVGFASAGETLEEGSEAIRAVPGAAKGYQHAVDILNRRRTPELTDLHLPRLPVEGGGRP